MLRCCNPCNSEAHNSGAARIVMGPYLALLAAQAELRALLPVDGAGPSQGSVEVGGDLEEEDQLPGRIGKRREMRLGEPPEPERPRKPLRLQLFNSKGLGTSEVFAPPSQPGSIGV